MQEPAQRRLHRTEIDGVPVYFAPTPGPTTAGLVFRVGWADETAVVHGITHLVEHLAMAVVGKTAYASNAMVDATLTTFFARGAPEEVADFVLRVCHALAALPMDRLGLEARVLRTEAQGRPHGQVSRMMWLRYGFQAEGLDWLPELALNNPRADFVQWWAADRFNRSNAAVWISGTMPDQLSVPLRAGNLYVAPRPQPIPCLVLPAAGHGGAGGVAISFETSRTAAATTAIRIAMSRFHDQIRVSQGLSYEVGSSRDPIDAQVAHDTIWVSCLDDHVAAVRGAMLRILADLCQAGPTQQELDEDLLMFIRQSTDPAAAMQEPATAAMYELVGMPPLDVHGLVEDRNAVTADDCRRELAAAMRTALILAPPGTPVLHQAGISAYPNWSAQRVTGREFVPEGTKPWKKTLERLIVGTDGVSLTTAENNVVTVFWRDCVALVSEEGRGRLVLGRDGFTVRFTADYWKDGDAALRLVDAAVQPQLRVPPPM